MYPMREYHALRTRMAREILLPKARTGDRQAALSVLSICAEAIADGAPMDSEVTTWLCVTLKAIAGGCSVEDAAGIPKRSRGKKKEVAVRQERGRRFMMAHEYGVRHKIDRDKKIVAAREVGSLFGVDEETVLSAWKEFGKQVMHEIDLEIRTLGNASRMGKPI